MSDWINEVEQNSSLVVTERWVITHITNHSFVCEMKNKDVNFLHGRPACFLFPIYGDVAIRLLCLKIFGSMKW